MSRQETWAGTPVAIDEPTGRPALDTLVLLHGWPDSAALWDDTVAVLASRWRCVRYTLPGYAPGDVPAAHGLAQVVEQLHQVVLQAGGGRPVTLLLHDWGCLFGYHFMRLHPALVSRVIGVDIGDAGSRAHQGDLNLKAKLGVLGYQLWLALAWRIGGGLGDRMARKLAVAMHVPTPTQSIRAQMGYPYWITWTGAHGSYRAVKAFGADEPRVPMLFLYGRRKPFMFHSRAWAQALVTRPGCRVVEMNTGHWVMLNAPADFQAVVTDWLAGSTPD